MKFLTIKNIVGSEREVKCPKGDFTSFRFLLESDGMGYTITKTVIPAGTWATWHYKNHLESCYCILGKAILIDEETKEYYCIEQDSLYALDKHDKHTFIAIEDTVLICVFNPPLQGKEIHAEDGSYSTKANYNV